MDHIAEEEFAAEEEVAPADEAGAAGGGSEYSAELDTILDYIIVLMEAGSLSE